ncbi:nucleotidyltransferase domain-containing protein [Candidatus Woesearchaeota archaeon]|nr:nucleotidyltransferase domain-containing protein [Candidatus Woesearchaeota archaeon]
MGILRALKDNPNVRRLFGKRELVIIQKQLLGVNLKESERTRLSRDIRKKFEVIEALLPFKEEFKLKKSAEINKLINEMKEVIFESRFFPKIKRILLFGSAVEGKLMLTSDIDIAVEFDIVTSEEAIDFRKEVLGKLNEKLDIEVYNLLPGKIKEEIKKKGKILYERKD